MVSLLSLPVAYTSHDTQWHLASSLFMITVSAKQIDVCAYYDHFAVVTLDQEVSPS